MGDLKNELQKMLEELELRKKKLSSLDFKQNQYVVLFKPVKGEGDLYGVTKKPLNKISSDIQDVLPVQVWRSSRLWAIQRLCCKQASKYSTIQVGDTTYKSFVMALWGYVPELAGKLEAAIYHIKELQKQLAYEVCSEK
jgi:hypothetical protein